MNSYNPVPMYYYPPASIQQVYQEQQPYIYMMPRYTPYFYNVENQQEWNKAANDRSLAQIVHIIGDISQAHIQSIEDQTQKMEDNAMEYVDNEIHAGCSRFCKIFSSKR